jgi:CDP-diacylglycerol--glycerol-3-phosphate 3-phosphatidyltransferase
MKKNIPNLLTIFRFTLTLLTAPWILLISKGNTQVQGIVCWLLWAVIVSLLMIIFITDFLDGYLARKWKVTSKWGMTWDPIVDYLIINILLIILFINGKIDLWLIATFIVRDVLITIIHIIIGKYQTYIAGAEWHGKLKTVFQMMGIMIIIIFIPFPESIDKKWLQLPLWISLITGMISLIIYFRNMINVYKNTCYRDA